METCDSMCRALLFACQRLLVACECLFKRLQPSAIRLSLTQLLAVHSLPAARIPGTFACHTATIVALLTLGELGLCSQKAVLAAAWLDSPLSPLLPLECSGQQPVAEAGKTSYSNCMPAPSHRPFEPCSALVLVWLKCMWDGLRLQQIFHTLHLQ